MNRMTPFLLPPERYGELPVEIDPALAIVVALEDPETKEIKGYWVAQNVVHIEPVWLSPELRSGIVGIKMYAALLAALQVAGVPAFYAFADREEIADYLKRLGLELTPYVTFKGITPCLQQSSQPSSQAE